MGNLYWELGMGVKMRRRLSETLVDGIWRAGGSH